jgi:hypothetical protein
MVAKSYDDMFPDGLGSVDNDILYGSEIKVTKVTGNAAGSKDTEISKYDLYRFVNITNPIGIDDQTVDLSTAAADGATSQEELIDLKTGDATRPTTLSVSDDQFSGSINQDNIDITADVADAELFAKEVIGSYDFFNASREKVNLFKVQTDGLVQANLYLTGLTGWLLSNWANIQADSIQSANKLILSPNLSYLPRDKAATAITEQVQSLIYSTYSSANPQVKPANAPGPNTIEVVFKTGKGTGDDVLGEAPLLKVSTIRGAVNDIFNNYKDRDTLSKIKRLASALLPRSGQAYVYANQILHPEHPRIKVGQENVAQFIVDLVDIGVHEAGHSLQLVHQGTTFGDFMYPSVDTAKAILQHFISSTRNALGLALGTFDVANSMQDDEKVIEYYLDSPGLVIAENFGSLQPALMGITSSELASEI